MNRQFVLILIVVAAVFAGTMVFAQQHRPYNDIMKDVGATWASLKKNLDSNAGAAAAQDAAKMQSLFAETVGFWAPLNTNDAVNYAKRAQEGAAAIEAAAKTNNMKAALDSYTATQKNCGNCHLAHREDTGKGFLIRP
jgi:cytochrome c556